MVASNIRLPNIRRMFVPDPGYTIVDADLSGADAQVVAWEADDEDLKTAFRAGIKIHVHNCRTMWPHQHKDMTDDEIKSESPFYRKAKAGCHAVNYGASENALVHRSGWERKFAQEFIERWFAAHPNIKKWHKRYQDYLYGSRCWNCDNVGGIVIGRPCPKCGSHLGRTIKNKFNFRNMFFKRIDGSIFGEAYAWTPQSTVAFCTELGWTSIAEGPNYWLQLGHSVHQIEEWKRHLCDPHSYERWHNVVQFLIQVHDSIVFQVPHAYEDDIPEIVKSLQVRIPYKDELIIPMGWKASRKSWGDCG